MDLNVPVVAFPEFPLLDHGAHGPVDDHDALQQLGLKLKTEL